MKNSYNNPNKYSSQPDGDPSLGERMSIVLNALFATVFSTTFLGFAVFLVLFSIHITPKDIAYFRTYAKSNAQTLVQSASTLASNASRLTADTITTLKEKAKENEIPEAMVVKEASVNSMPKDAVDTVEIILESCLGKVTYFSQTDDRWGDTIYGNSDTIGVYGCGPTTVAMLATSLTDVTVYPNDAATWAYNNGEFANSEGSYHSIIVDGASNYGLTTQSLIKPSKDTLIDELNKGNLVVVLMDRGHFTSGGHFIILRGVTENGEVLIADAKSLENSQMAWDFNVIISEAKYGASSGGPFWSVGKK